MKTSTSRTEKHDKKLIESGGRKLNGIRLSPEASTALSDIEKSGESATKAINRLLISEASNKGKLMIKDVNHELER